MIITLTTILCFIQILTQHCKCLNLVELTDMNNPKPKDYKGPPKVKFEPYTVPKAPSRPIRRYWLLNSDRTDNNDRSTKYTKKPYVQPRVYEDEHDANIKQKISALVQQTMQDAQRKMKLTDDLKEEHRDELPYRAGFILSLVKKTKDVLDELFNVAVKHREEWLALEQLKIFELIVHTNVDTTNLLRQLVDVHVKHINSTRDKERVILI